MRGLYRVEQCSFLLLSLVEDGAGVGVDQDVFALGLESLVEVGLAVELGVARHVCGELCWMWDMNGSMYVYCSPNAAMKTKEEGRSRRREDQEDLAFSYA